MDTNDNKYDEVLKFLKRSTPGIRHPEIMTDKIMESLKKEKSPSGLMEFVGNIIFGWVYIGWVRRGMIAFSAFILFLFIYQQSVIIRRINAIDRQVVTSGIPATRDIIEKSDPRNLLKRIEYLIPSGNKALTQKGVDALIESLIDLQVKYKDILKLIQEDPELRKYFEERLNEKDSKKHNP